MFERTFRFILLLPANSPHYVIRTGWYSISFISSAGTFEKSCSLIIFETMESSYPRSSKVQHVLSSSNVIHHAVWYVATCAKRCKQWHISGDDTNLKYDVIKCIIRERDQPETYFACFKFGNNFFSLSLYCLFGSEKKCFHSHSIFSLETNIRVKLFGVDTQERIFN